MRKIEGILSDENKSPVNIRHYRAGDAGYISYRHGVLYEKEYNLDTVFEKYVMAGLLKFLDNPESGELWMAEADGKIVGFIAIIGIDEKNAQLRWFLIEPEFRGKGLGHQLMAEALGYCRRKKFTRVYLWTFKGLDAARHLYSCTGFIQTEEAANDTWRKGLIEEKWELDLTK